MLCIVCEPANQVCKDLARMAIRLCGRRFFDAAPRCSQKEILHRLAVAVVFKSVQMAKAEDLRSESISRNTRSATAPNGKSCTKTLHALTACPAAASGAATWARPRRLDMVLFLFVARLRVAGLPTLPVSRSHAGRRAAPSRLPELARSACLPQGRGSCFLSLPVSASPVRRRWSGAPLAPLLAPA